MGAEYFLCRDFETLDDLTNQIFLMCTDGKYYTAWVVVASAYATTHSTQATVNIDAERGDFAIF